MEVEGRERVVLQAVAAPDGTAIKAGYALSRSHPYLMRLLCSHPWTAMRSYWSKVRFGDSDEQDEPLSIMPDHASLSLQR